MFIVSLYLDLVTIYILIWRHYTYTTRRPCETVRIELGQPTVASGHKLEQSYKH